MDESKRILIIEKDEKKGLRPETGGGATNTPGEGVEGEGATPDRAGLEGLCSEKLVDLVFILATKLDRNVDDMRSQLQESAASTEEKFSRLDGLASEQAEACSQQKNESSEERVALQKRLEDLQQHQEELLLRHQELVTRFDELKQSYDTVVNSHDKVLEKQTKNISKLEGRAGEQEKKQEQQQEETRREFKSVTDHIMNHIAEKNANLNAALEKDKEEADKKMDKVLELIHNQLGNHEEKHKVEQASISQHTESINKLVQQIDDEFREVRTIEESRQKHEDEQNERVTNLERSSGDGLKQLKTATEKINVELKLNKSEIKLLKQELCDNRVELRDEIRTVRTEMEDNASKDKDAEEALNMIRDTVETNYKQSTDIQKKVETSLKSLADSSKTALKSIEVIKSDMIDQGSKRRSQEGKFHNQLECQKKEQARQARNIEQLEVELNSLEERRQAEVLKVEAALKTSHESQSKLEKGLTEKAEATRDHIGQVQRSLRCSSKEECERVASESKSSIGEVCAQNACIFR